MQDVSTAGQLALLRQSFDQCDSNGDGWIIAGEFSELLKTLDHGLSQHECLLAFEATDTDGDGAISFEEFMGWWAD